VPGLWRLWPCVIVRVVEVASGWAVVLGCEAAVEVTRVTGPGAAAARSGWGGAAELGHRGWRRAELLVAATLVALGLVLGILLPVQAVGAVHGDRSTGDGSLPGWSAGAGGLRGPGCRV